MRIIAATCVIAVLLMVSTAHAVVHFTFTYFDPPGFGFADPVLGPDRMMALEEVAAMVGSRIEQDAIIEIGVAPSELDGTGFSAAAGAEFPDAIPPAFGVMAGEVHDRIVSGIPDTHPGFDAGLVVDFGYDFMLDMVPPGPTEIDFRGVMLHELTHILGFGSFIDSDGTGLYPTPLGTPNVYTLFDSFVTTPGGVPVIDAGTGMPTFGPGMFSALYSAGLGFSGPETVGANGGSPLILAPSDPSHSGTPSHLMFPFAPPGVDLPDWSALEIHVLRDLGYDIELPPLCDFDGDFFCTTSDINALVSVGNLVAGVAVVPGLEAFDIDGSGVINETDLDFWLALAGDAHGLTGPYKRGDADLDGSVNGSDFLAWNAHKFTVDPLWTHGNFNGDSAIEGVDFLLWNANKFTTVTDLNVVPEPSASLPWAMLLLLPLRRRWGTLASSVNPRANA